MALTSTPVFPQTPKNGKTTLTTVNTPVTVYTGGSNGSKVFAMIATSNDTSAHDVQITLLRSATSYLLGTVNVPIGAGNTGTVPSVNLFNAVQMVGLPIDSDNNPFIFLLDASDSIQATFLTALGTGGRIITVTAVAADF